MKKLFACLALAFVAPMLSLLHAQDEQASEQYEPPPPEGIDVDYFAPPKQKLTVGLSILSGPKISFSGTGSIPSDVNPGADSTTTTRTYDDGTVSPDTRVDVVSQQPLQSTSNVWGKGFTNSWSYDSASQVNGNTVDMHAYSAVINGVNSYSGQSGIGTGWEVTYERDFDWHVGKLEIDIVGSLDINRISYSRTENVSATMTTLTDQYNVYNIVPDVNGDPVTNPPTPAGDPQAAPNGNPVYVPGPPPAAPYTAPSTGTDNNGNSTNNTSILSSEPTNIPTAPTPTEVTEQWNITGAYFTLRAGPEITLPFTKNFSASVSGGPAVVYVGTTFTVNQTLNPPTGNPITSTVSDDYYTVLPAYFADANIQYSFTDTTGFYLGAVFQGSTGYNQSIHSPDADYTDRVELGNEEGVRAGINFKF